MKEICKIMIFNLFIICSCYNRNKSNMPIEFDESGLAYIQKKLFSGIHLNYFDDGSIKSKNNYLKGIRHGEWVVYGYSGEILQSGKYIEAEKIKSRNLDRIKSIRKEVNIWNEGNNKNLDIYIYLLEDSLSEQKIIDLKKEIKTLDKYKDVIIQINKVIIENNK